jgi:hypothetical protein
MTELVDDLWDLAFEHIPDEVEQSVLDELNAILVLEVDPDYYAQHLARRRRARPYGLGLIAQWPNSVTERL